MISSALQFSVLLASATATCNTGSPASVDLCSKIPIIGKGGWSVSWPIPLMKNISSKAIDGSTIRIDDITITKVWIGGCSLTGTTESLTAAAEGAGLELRATSVPSGKSVQATAELGDLLAQVLKCEKPSPSQSGMMHGKAHIEGDTLATTIEVSELPKVLWSPVSLEKALVPEVASMEGSSDSSWLFQLAHPVIEAMLNQERSATAAFDWCSALSPIMHKSVQCTSAKACNLEDIANKVMGYLKLGSLPYKLPQLFNVFVASGDAYVDNPRITQIISPECSAKTSLPLSADVTASGLQVVVQIDLRVHICVWFVFCHDLHPTTFATLTLPGAFAATVTQPEGLLSLRVSQSLTEYAVDAKWDEFLLAAADAPSNSAADDLEKCAKTLTKGNTTGCDALALEVAHRNLAIELASGNLGAAIRPTIMDFVGLQIDGAAPPNARTPIGVSNAEETEILI